MKSLILSIAFTLLSCLAVKAQPCEYKLGPPLPGEFYSVGHHIEGLGIPTGEYEGRSRIFLIDPETAEWSHFGSLTSPERIESISIIQKIDGGAGLNAWTENGSGAQCFTAWRDQGWKWQLTQSFAKPWALAGPSATGGGVVAVSDGRKNRVAGGWLLSWGQSCWEPITPLIPDVMIWDAIPWKGGYLLGCSLGNGQYLEEWAGRLVVANTTSWRVVDTPEMAGIIRLYRFDTWPGFLWLATTWGEVYRTSDLETFELWHRGDYGHNSFLFEINGALIVASSGGKVWKCDPECLLVVEIPNTDFMSLSPAKGGLAGVWTERRAGKSRPVSIFLEN